jgi:large subunit ribosomal protein L4
MQVNLYNQKGETVGKVKLKPEIFGVEVKPEVIHQVAVAMMSNARERWAHAKTRGEVRGGGRKPWRQKGTGRARHGSIRSPLWRGGGVTFGPARERTYKKKINKKVKMKALLMCLSDKVKDDKLIVLDELKLDAPKTKYFIQVLKSLPVEGKVLFVLPRKDEAALLSSRNLSETKVKTTGDLNVLDLLNFKFLVLTKESIENLGEKYIK